MKCESCVGIRPTFEILSSVIFRQPTLVIERLPIICSNHSRNAISTDDILSEKVFNVCLSNSHKCLALYPLSKVVDNDNDVLLLSRSLWKWTEKIHSLVSKRNGGDDGK